MTELARAETLLRAALDQGDLRKIEAARCKVINAPGYERTEPTLLGSALWYARHGLRVFPLRPLGKKPWPKSHGFEDATLDPDVIRGWWGPSKAPSNIGIATGHGVDVIDIDGPVGQRSRLDNWDLFELFDVIAVVSTPRPGGLHLWVPSNGDGNSSGTFPGIDYRGLGGYVLAPPSVLDERDEQHPGTYRFIRPPDPERLPKRGTSR